MTDARLDEVEAALAATIREALIDGQRIVVPGLGSFGVRHQPSRIERGDDGVEKMIPPRDVVDFLPEP